MKCLVERNERHENGETVKAAVPYFQARRQSGKIINISSVKADTVIEKLAKLRPAIKDLDVIELNEAFAAQALAVMRELDLPLIAPTPTGAGSRAELPSLSLTHPELRSMPAFHCWHGPLLLSKLLSIPWSRTARPGVKPGRKPTRRSKEKQECATTKVALVW